MPPTTNSKFKLSRDRVVSELVGVIAELNEALPPLGRLPSLSNGYRNTASIVIPEIFIIIIIDTCFILQTEGL